MENNSGISEFISCDGILELLAQEYILCCRDSEEPSDTEEKRRSAKIKKRFPNVAGFCRYLGISEAEYEKVKHLYPIGAERIEMAFEDEALNSDVSPTLLSAYLKRRLGYEKSSGSEIYDGQIRVVFDHDITEDGE